MSDTVNLDEQLEKVNIALMEGDLALAVELLPEIIEKGDEDQRQIAEAYLEMLFELQAETDIDDDEDIPDGLFAGDDEEEDAILGWDDDETAETQTHVDSTEITETPSEIEKESAEMATNDAIETAPAKQEILFDNSIEPLLIDMPSEVVETPDDKHIHEMEVALEQAKILFDKQEVETAEAVLDAVFDKGSDTQKSRAEKLQLLIDSAKSSLDNEATIAETEETLSEIVKDSESEALVEVETILDSNENTNYYDQLYTPAVDLKDYLIAASQESPPQLDEIDDQLNEVEQNDLETKNSEVITNVENNDENEEITITVVEDNSKIESFVDTFNDNEAVDELLAPSMALKTFAAQPDELLSNLTGNSTQSHADLKRHRRQGFMIGDTRLMIDFADGNELLEMPKYIDVPNSPHWLVGLTNMHGVVVPIFDLVSFLGLPEATRDKKSMLLVMEHNEKAVGVVVNGFPRRLAWDESNEVNNNTAPSVLREHLKRVCLLNDILWFDLNVTSLCNLLEKSL